MNLPYVSLSSRGQVSRFPACPATEGSVEWVSGPRSGFLILIVYTLLTLILTCPLLFNLRTTVPNDIGDPLLNTWILAWDSHALLTNPLNLFNANIFYPLPNTLAYSEHLFSTVLLALPVQLISAEPIVAYNLSLLATFPLAAFGMYLLTFRWTRQRGAAFVAGLIFAFAPYRFAAIAHLQLLTFQWLPFVVLALDKILDKRRLASARPQTHSTGSWQAADRRPLILALFLILQLLTSWYLALYTLVIVGIYLLTRLAAKQLNKPAIGSSPWLLLISTFLISFVLILPLARPYLSLLDDLRAARPLSLALSLAAAPTDFLAAAPFNRLFGPLTEMFRARPGFTEENTLFSGFAAPLLALVSVITIILRLATGFFRWVRPNERHASDMPNVSPPTPYSLLLTPYFLLPTPYSLLLLLLLSLLLTFPAPYAILAALFPPSTIIRVPPRWIIPALFALAGLAAYGYIIIMPYILRFTSHPSTSLGRAVSRFTFHVSSLVFFFICFLLLLETFSIPIPLAPVEHRAILNPAYHWLAAQPGDVALIELPLYSAPAPEYPEVKRLYASTLGWWKLVNGYSGYTPPRQPKLAQNLADFPGPKSITALQNLASFTATSSTHPTTSQLPFPTFQPSNLPTFHPPLFLFVHPGQAPFDRSRWEATLRWQAERNPALHPLGQFEDDYLYQVLPPNPARFTVPPLATFGQDQTIQLLAYDLSFSNLQPSTPNLQPPTFILLYWRSTVPLPTGYTVFIHLRAPDGFVRSQADGPPVSGHYPTTAWQPGEVIQDIHPWPDIEVSQVDHLAVGLYNPATGERLPAFGPDGRRLAEDALIIPRDRFLY